MDGKDVASVWVHASELNRIKVCSTSIFRGLVPHLVEWEQSYYWVSEMQQEFHGLNLGKKTTENSPQNTGNLEMEYELWNLTLKVNMSHVASGAISAGKASRSGDGGEKKWTVELGWANVSPQEVECWDGGKLTNPVQLSKAGNVQKIEHELDRTSGENACYRTQKF
ncbi:hypothetical protein Tco_0087322 [Tanacetum coccineum]